MKILILGSEGQIGKPLVKYLKKENHIVYEFDIIANILEDLRSPHILNAVLSEVDFVFFLAFDVGGSIYLKNYQDTYDFISNNIKIMNNTFDSLKKYNTPFLFASTQMSTLISSTYGTLKRIGEKYTNNLNGKIIKMWNVYGPQEISIKSHVITDFINMAKTNGSIFMKTNGEELRQFLYVEDCCKCFDIIMSNFSDIDEKELHVSSFKWIKIKDVAKIIASNFNNCKIYSGTEEDDIQRGSLREPNEYVLDFWKPEITINQGIKYIIENGKI